MALYGAKARFDQVQSLKPGTYKVTANSGSIDCSNADAVSVVISIGTITDGTFAFTLQESDSSGSGFTNVAAADMVGAFVAGASNSVQKVDYIGLKRYLQVTVTVGGSPATGAAMEILGILHDLNRAPVGATFP